MKHTTLSDEEIKELVTKITTARYDSVAELFTQLTIQFTKDCTLYAEKERFKLAIGLNKVAEACWHIHTLFESIWIICKDKMKEDK